VVGLVLGTRVSVVEELTDHPVVLHIALPGVAEQVDGESSMTCLRCGSHGFTVHQRAWKQIRDPHIARVEVLRLQCKRCGRVVRRYPAGVGAGRQSDAVVQLSVLLHDIGLTYEVVRGLLASLRCGVSATTIRHNVEAARRSSLELSELSRLQLELDEDGHIHGPDGLMSIRVAGTSHHRWLEVEIDPGPSAEELRWRIEYCADRLIGALPQVSPPESV
jgi:hypothetical protein